MQKNKKKRMRNDNRAQLSGFLFANFGQSVGIDCVPFLAKMEDEKTAKKMLKGRDEFLKSKKVQNEKQD